jgi:type VI protein secretion system component VasK
MNLDHDLKHALRRQRPDPGFAGRVLARIEREQAHQPRVRPLWWRAAAASVLLALVLGGGYAAHERAERREGERARAQVMQALHIAGEKVRYAQQEVREIGSHD